MTGSRITLIILIATLLSYFSIIASLRLVTFHPFLIPDVFASFGIETWALLIIFSILACILFLRISDYPSLLSTDMIGMMLVIMVWSILYAAGAYGLSPWQSSQEQTYFANAVISGTPFRNGAWPASYYLQDIFAAIVHVSTLQANVILGAFDNICVPLILYLIGRKIFETSRQGAILFPIIYELSQVYYFRYFSDYLFSFVFFLILIYMIYDNKSRHNPKSVIFSVLFLGAVLGNPITAILLMSFYGLYTVFCFVLKSKINWSQFLSMTIIFVSWYVLNGLAFGVVETFSLGSALGESSAYSLRSYVTLSFEQTFSYILLYYAHYFIYAIFGAIALIGLFIMARNKKRDTVIPIALLLSVVAISLPIIALQGQQFDNRILVFAFIPISIFITRALSSNNKVKVIACLVILLTPFSFSLSFFPSNFNTYTHNWEFNGSNFVAGYSTRATIIVTDGYTSNFIAMYNPAVLTFDTVSSVTVRGGSPSTIYIPSSSSSRQIIVVRSLRQDSTAFVAFGINRSAWNSVDNRLNNNFDSVYDSGNYSVYYEK